MASEIQSIVFDDWLSTGGTFTLSFDGLDTGVVTMLDTDTVYDLSTTLQAAFDSAYGSGDMTVYTIVDVDPIELHVYFSGGAYDELDVALLVVDSYSGPTSPSVTEYQQGGDHYTETAEEYGLLFGGEAGEIHGIGYSDTAEGGILFAGDVEEYQGFHYINTATGGIRFGGIATHTKTTAHTATGGIRFGGAGTNGHGKTITATGGIRFGGELTPSIGFNDTASGGIEFGGDGILQLSYNTTGTGGIIFGQAIYSNGHKYRYAITIPAAKVAADLTNFILPVRATLPTELASSNVAFSDSVGNELRHDLVGYSTATGKLHANVKCDVATASPTTLYVYFGG